MRTRRPLAERFWEKVRKGDGCWEWTASLFPFGYGRFTVDKDHTSVQAHKISWELTSGPIPKGLFVCHSCDNPPCVRPDHLWLGTIQDNTADMDRKGRRVSVPPPPRAGAANGNAKLGAQDVEEIRDFLAEGVKQTTLARAFGVSQAHISRIALRRNRVAG